jgi:hypothetical protein
MDKLYFEAYRLGELSNNIRYVEPVLRDANIVTLDLKSIRSSEVSSKQKFSPNGFSGKEICAISRYAGISNKVSSFGIYEYIPSVEDEATEMLIAQILWYFIEGVNCRVMDSNFYNEDDFQKYTVLIDDQELVFLKSVKSSRWWVEIPFLKEFEGSLVWVALVVSLGGIIISWFVGWFLPGLEYNNQKVEAAFRKDLVLGEDNKKDYAQPEKLWELFLGIRFNYQRLYKHYSYFDGWMHFYDQIMIIVPYLVVGPGLFTGLITLGIVMQVSNAFQRVHGGFALFLHNWTTITELRSIWRRLTEFEKNLTLYENKITKLSEKS